MADEFKFLVSRGYLQLVRNWVADPERPGFKRGGRYPRKRVPFEDREPDWGRGEQGQSSRSRNNMRRLFLSLPWELLGPWPAMITLTYPGEWQGWVKDGREWERHRRAFERRWVRRWGEPLVGVWAKEFQRSGRPHLHLYVGLPRCIQQSDFRGLQERTKLRRRLERQYAGTKRAVDCQRSASTTAANSRCGFVRPGRRSSARKARCRAITLVAN